MIFPIQSSKFIKSLSFGSNLKQKNCKKNFFIFLFQPKNLFLYIWNSVYSDKSELDLSHKTMKFKISLSVESYDENTVDNWTVVGIYNYEVLSKFR